MIKHHFIYISDFLKNYLDNSLFNIIAINIINAIINSYYLPNKKKKNYIVQFS